MAESFAIRLQEKMDKEGGASPVDMDIVSHVSINKVSRH